MKRVQIENMFALGPIATVGHIEQGLLKALAPYVNEISVESISSQMY